MRIAGYVAVPQGRVVFGAADPGATEVTLTGGLLAGEFSIDPAGAPTLDIRFANPTSQKLIRITSIADLRYTATSTAIVQVNESGSIAINSWVVQ